MPSDAIVLADGMYTTPHGKTAHGLVRRSERFPVVPVVRAHAAAQRMGHEKGGLGA